MQRQATAGNVIFALLLFIGGALQAWADGPVATAPEYHHRMWTAENGLGAVVDIQQADDGYLWLTTSTGIFRFDGVRFESLEDATNGAVHNGEIHDVALSASGGVWLTTRAAGLLFWKNDQLTEFPDRRCTPALQMEGIAEGRDGSLWIQSSVGLFHLKGSVCEQIGPEHGYPGGFAAALLVDREGTVWVRTLAGALLFLPLGGSNFQRLNYDAGPTSAAFVLATATHNSFLHQAPDGSIWLSDSRGLRRVTDRGVPVVSSPFVPGNADNIQFGDFTFGPDGDIWAVSDKGLLHFDRSNGWKRTEAKDISAATKFTTRQGLSSDAVWKVLIDREGSVWVGTNSGLDQLRRTRLYTLALPSAQQHDFSIAASDDGAVWTGNRGLPLTRVTQDGTITSFPTTHGTICLRVDRDGTLWSAGGGDSIIWRVDGSTLSPLHYPEEETGPVISLAIDRNRDLWISTATGGTYHSTGGRWLKQNDALGKKAGVLGAMTSDDAGNIWFGYSNNLALWNGSKYSKFSFPHGTRGVSETTMSARGGHVWLGGSAGIQLFTDGHFNIVRWADHDLPGRVSGVLESRTGDLWINGFSGITHVSAGELLRWIHNPSYAVSAEHLDALDGLPGLSAERIPEPSLAESRDGRLWFATTQGIAWLNPSQLSENRNHWLPPVHISSIVSDGITYAGSKDLALPAHSEKLGISYTALSLAIPERVRFRYKLEGFDSAWQDAGALRQAFYTRLPPGNYRFRVIASNNDGVWNEVGASLGIVIKAAFYQTRLFLAAVTLVAISMLWFGVRLRIANITRQLQQRLAERLAERERIARELHDTLLQSVFALTYRFQSAAKRLPTDDPARVELDKALQEADEVMREGRDRVLNLRARQTESTSLEDAFAEIGNKLQSIHMTHFRMVAQSPSQPLDAIAQDEIFFIGREALTNAFTHSGAQNIEIELQYRQDALYLRICDDGRGLDDAVLKDGYRSGHWGLLGMRERAGKIRGVLRIGGRDSGGTQVELIVPAAIAYPAASVNRASSWNPLRRK